MRKIALPRIPRELAVNYPDSHATYRACYHAAVEGRFPTDIVNGRYYIKEDDLPRVAAALGLAEGIAA